MVGSFFITERLSPSELNKIAELSKDELGRIIDGALADAGSKVEESIDAQIAASSEKVERALEKETNEKIMAISEYSDTVMENMNKTHNEIMFLYNMLNDKHAELTGLATDLQKIAANVKSIQEGMAKKKVPEPAPVAKPEPVEEKRIREDKKNCGVQCEMSRSNQFYIMLSLLREGAITFDDLEDFSDDLKDMMKRIADN